MKIIEGNISPRALVPYKPATAIKNKSFYHEDTKCTKKHKARVRHTDDLSWCPSWSWCLCVGNSGLRASPALGLVVEWASLHKDELMMDWELAKTNQPPKEIEPLRQEYVSMLYDVIKADYIKDYKVKVEFEDGHSGIVDFAPYVQKGGVFDQFSDLSFFKRFSVSEALGTIVWDDQIDVAPETLYEKCEPYASTDG